MRNFGNTKVAQDSFGIREDFHLLLNEEPLTDVTVTEIRNLIYEIAINKAEPVELYYAPPPSDIRSTALVRAGDCFALTQANRQIRSEFLILYYSKTEFQISALSIKKFSTIFNKTLRSVSPSRLRIDLPYTGVPPG
jgi:hypothetical protein